MVWSMKLYAALSKGVCFCLFLFLEISVCRCIEQFKRCKIFIIKNRLSFLCGDIFLFSFCTKQIAIYLGFLFSGNILSIISCFGKIHNKYFVDQNSVFTSDLNNMPSTFFIKKFMSFNTFLNDLLHLTEQENVEPN